MHAAHVLPALAFAVAAASGCAGDQAAMASWADRELAKLIDPIEEHRKTFGCYPDHLYGPQARGADASFATYRSLPDPRGFPRPSPNFDSFVYADLDIDNYVLGAVLKVATSQRSPSPQWETIGILTTGKGCVREIPRFVGLSFFDSASLLGTRGRWSFWFWSKGGVQRGGTSLGDFLVGLTHADPGIRAAAASALGRSGRAEDALESLVETLSDQDGAVRSAATWALGRLKDGRALAALKNAQADPDPAVRTRANWAFDQIEQTLRKGPRPDAKVRYTSFEDWCDFEDLKPGEYPGAGGWCPLFVRAGGAAAVTEEVAYQGRRSFRIESGSGSARCEYRGGSRSLLPERVSWEIAVLPNPAAGSHLRVGFLERFGGVCRFYNAFGLSTGDRAAGAIEFQKSDSGPPVKLWTFSVGEWVLLKAELDFVNCTGTFWVNGKQAAADAPILPRSLTDEQHGPVRLGKWGISEQGGQRGPGRAVHVDAYRMTGSSVPSK